MDLFEALQIVWRRKGLILLVLFLTCGSAYGVSKLLPKAYEAQTTLIFPRADAASAGALASLLSGTGLGRMSGFPGIGGLVGGSQTSAETVEALLRSRTLATRVVQELDLQRVYHTRTLEQTVKALQNATTIRTEKTEAMKVAVRAPDRQTAATVANRMIAEMEQLTEEKVDLFLARKNRRFVEGQLARTRRNLADAEERLKRFHEQNRIVSLQDETRAAIESLAELAKEQTLAQVAAVDTDAQLDEVRRQVQEQTSQTVEDLPAHSPIIADLRQKYEEVSGQLVVARVEFTESHPTVQQLSAQAAEMKRQIDVEAQRVRASLKTGLAPELAKLEVERIATVARTGALGRAIDASRRKFDELPEAGLQLARLIRERTVQESLYTLLTAEYERARLTEAREGPGFVVLDRAVPPEKHVFPRTMINVIIAGVLGLWLGVTLALLAERAQTARFEPPSTNGTGPEPREAPPLPKEAEVAQVGRDA
jgi:uncharacterized protein involved in exopolysaccharide biosynthesis